MKIILARSSWHEVTGNTANKVRDSHFGEKNKTLVNVDQNGKIKVRGQKVRGNLTFLER